MKKRWWIAIALIFLFIFIVKAETVSAAYNIENDLDLKIPTNETNCNLTIEYPNTSNLVTEVTTTDNKGFFNYTISKNSLILGEYKYFSDCGSGSFEVTSTGQTLDTSDALIYSMMLIFFATLIYLIIKLISIIPENNTTDDLGNLVGVNKVKYLRPVLWGVVWVLVIGMSFILSNVGLTYLPDTMLGDIFFFIFRFMMIMSVPMVILWAIYLFVNIFRDKEINKLIYQGFEVQNGKS